MLRAMHSRLANGLKLKQVSYSFEYTVMWESAWKHSGKLRVASNAEPIVVGLDALLDELRLKGTEYDRYRQLARERFLAIRETDRLGVRVSPARKKKTETADKSRVSPRPNSKREAACVLMIVSRGRRSESGFRHPRDKSSPGP